MTTIDHIAVAASSLEVGVAYVEEMLGVSVPKGGEHPSMATHNHLMQLGNNTFLEVIAINTEMTAPVRPRWFGLDDPFVRESIEKQPRLHTWIVNSSDIHGIAKQCDSECKFNIGEITAVSRGELNWHFAIPDDGRLLASGLVPYVMQWDGQEQAGFSHPSQGMADLGCELVGLELHHPQATWLASILDSIKAKELVTLSELPPHSVPYMTAKIQTPQGLKELSSEV